MKIDFKYGRSRVVVRPRGFIRHMFDVPSSSGHHILVPCLKHQTPTTLSMKSKA
ncbi:hypothetical protein SAMN05192553_102667 [Cyclobacterium xiamenense]|uniref:Uncharacterized protein n=1 Tax=Cyclobacterium xiamenense TaxID=1297121 RepID=A0A1H6WTG0_9BACT|nr:hypothetical protein SAMN05192553_102667 [Cyclobacterium xiamenense]